MLYIYDEFNTTNTATSVFDPDWIEITPDPTSENNFVDSSGLPRLSHHENTLCGIRAAQKRHSQRPRLVIRNQRRKLKYRREPRIVENVERTK